MHRPSPIRAHRPAGPGRRPRFAVALAVAVLAGIGASSAIARLPAAKSVRAPGCALAGAKTIKASGDARVFRTGGRGVGKVYGCRRSASRAFELGYAGECQNNEEIRLTEVAGRRAALGIFECSLHAGWWRVALVNLGSGRREFAAAPIGSPAPSEATFDALRRIVVSADGAVAWTATRSAGGVTSAVEVRRRVRGSASTSILLDSGADIDAGSLRKRGRTLSWTKAGARRTARF